MNVVDLLDEQEAVVLVEACFHFLQWLLSAGGKDIWIEDDDDVEPLFTGEVRRFFTLSSPLYLGSIALLG